MQPILKILCSTASLEEARLLVELGVDIVDVKNPFEGSLGAQTPWVVREIAAYAAQHRVAVSAALGDLPFKPGTASLAAYGLAQLGPNYIKAGLHGIHSHDQAVELLSAIRRAIEMVDGSISLVAAGYADYRMLESITPRDAVRAAAETGCTVVMLDTVGKRRGSLFDFITEQDLHGFVASARQSNLQVALAGSIGIDHIPLLQRLAPDIIGVRGGLCRSGERTGRIDPHRSRSFLTAMRSA